MRINPSSTQNLWSNQVPINAQPEVLADTKLQVIEDSLILPPWRKGCMPYQLSVYRDMERVTYLGINFILQKMQVTEKEVESVLRGLHEYSQEYYNYPVEIIIARRYDLFTNKILPVVMVTIADWVVTLCYFFEQGSNTHQRALAKYLLSLGEEQIVDIRLVDMNPEQRKVIGRTVTDYFKIVVTGRCFQGEAYNWQMTNQAIALYDGSLIQIEEGE